MKRRETFAQIVVGHHHLCSECQGYLRQSLSHGLNKRNRRLAVIQAIAQAFCPLLQAQPEQDLKDVFAVFDKSGNGSVTRDELREALKVSWEASE